MSELSERLMVSNGNLTGLTERLVKEGLVSRRAPDNDRRMQRIRLTAAGKRALNAMTPGHHRWINEMFDGMGAHEREQLYELMGELKRSVQTACQKNPQVRSCLPRPGPGAPAR
jgi:DNA-binding MarR family transcriptional regulator